MNYKKLQKTIKDEPAYRLKQVNQSVFKDFISNWDQASALPLKLRQKLAVDCPLDIKATIFPSADKATSKALIELEDGLKIETVLLRHNDGRNTVCVSSQVGCPLGCLFCATGKMGFQRNLTDWEIIEQVLFFARILKPESKKVTNIVFMGMGEPFLNYQNVISAIKQINDPEYFNIGARHISISTIGITDGIKKLATENLPVNLAISLHATQDSQRSQIIPMTKSYPLKNIFKTVDNYINQTNRRVMFEYLLIKDFNDSPSQAKELAKLMNNPLYFVNLIAYNQTGKLKSSPLNKIKEFKHLLQRQHISVTQRYKFGTDIDAACGQLATDNK